MAWHLLLVANHMGTQSVSRGKAGLTGIKYRTLEGSLRGVDLSDVAVEMVRPREGFGAVGADIRFLYPTLVRTDMVAHAVLPLEALLTDWAGERLLV